ncbi:MAG: hypothetical protein U0271_39150 [Polyangiaceae bacterium]
MACHLDADRLRRLSAAAVVALGVLSLLSAGCAVDVNIGLKECDLDDGSKLAAGDSYAPDVCTSCTCQSNGEVECAESPCKTCDWNGMQLEPGTVIGDDCQSCYCDPGSGTLVCEAYPCLCSTDPPACDQPGNPGCTSYAICDATIGWSCVVDCSNDCAMQPLPDCVPPSPDCYFTGPICLDNQWSCGDLVCGVCSDPPPVCPDPGMPDCVGEAVCGPNGWTCSYSCSNGCADPAPDCPPDTLLECDPAGWICTPFVSSCGSDIPACTAPADPSCVSYATCRADGVWSCQDECPPENCGPLQTPCEVGPPECAVWDVCTTTGWGCAEHCN